MIAIIDYDAGNLKSVEKAFLYLGEAPVVTRDPYTILKANKVVLPGVGAFGDAMDKLNHYGLVDIIREVTDRKIPLFGICLGMQILFEQSEESGKCKGLSLLKGKILRIPDEKGLKIPHMGWNSLEINSTSRLYMGIPNHSHAYFVHSYYLQAMDESIISATTEYGIKIHASVECDNIFGCQFHPEKSGETGLKMLKNFIEL